MLKSVYIRVCSVAVCLAMLLLAGVGSGEEYDVKEPDKCLLNFSVMSDSHIEGNNFTRYKVFAHAVQDVNRNRSGNDAVVFLGDNTMNGHRSENMFFHGTVRLLLRDENVLTALGNHDIGNGQGDYQTLQNRWYDFTAAIFDRKLDHPYYCEIIDGYSFIVLGEEAQRVHEMPISDAQFDFLEDALATAADSGKPAFVFLHFPTDRASDMDLAPTDRLERILAQYDREHDLFVFVGHTHMPLQLYRSFRRDYGYPEIYLPCLTRLTGEKDNVPIEGTGIGIEVEVYEDEVVLRGRDFFRSKWFVNTEQEDGTLCEKTYTLKNAVSAAPAIGGGSESKGA